jgi:hypothetical protein
MRSIVRDHYAAVAVLLTIGSLTQTAAGANLSGVMLFSAQANGDLDNLQGYSTQVGGFGYNIFLTDDGLNGPFINGPGLPFPGPADATAAISVPLTYGTHTFGFYANNPDGPRPYHGLNLFFSGDNVNPGISAYAETNTSATPPFPSFAPNSGNTFTVDIVPVPGAGTLSVVIGGQTITLTDFVVDSPAVLGANAVGPYGTGPDAYTDLTGTFTLLVVPEPSALVIGILAAVGGFGFIACRRVQRTTDFRESRSCSFQRYRDWSGPESGTYARSNAGNLRI